MVVPQATGQSLSMKRVSILTIRKQRQCQSKIGVEDQVTAGSEVVKLFYALLS